MSELPHELAYLEPVIADWEGLEPDEIDESVDTSLLLATLKGRVQGLTTRAAAQRLSRDRELLQSWLASQPQHPGHFIAAFIEPEGLAAHLNSLQDAPRVAKKLRKATPTFRIELTTPEGFQRVDQRGSIILLGAAAGFVISPTTAEAQLASSEQVLALAGRATDAVAIGKWRGRASQYAGRVFLWLELDGHHVDVAVDAGGKQLDQARISSVLASLSYR